MTAAKKESWGEASQASQASQMAAIPPRLARRPRDRRGYPIPFSNWVAADGTPDFRVLDQERVGSCVRHRLCSLCGDVMGGLVAFIGGPGCVAAGQFYDPPMHRDCAMFAIMTCPHLATSKGRYSDAERLPVEPGFRFHARDHAPDKADCFALMGAKQYVGRYLPGEGYLITARLPWTYIRWYRDRVEVEAPSTFQTQPSKDQA
jgi:hypothetical protein